MRQKQDDDLVGSRGRTEYDSFPRPLSRILAVLSIFLIAGLVALGMAGPVIIPAGSAGPNYIMLLTFSVNLAVFTSVWIVYFSSPLPGPARCQTLRMLLRTETKPWAAGQAVEEEGDSRSNTGSALTAQAVFIAIAVFIINMIADQNGLITNPDSGVINRFFALSALLAASLSFVLLLISVDALETTFNEFTGRGFVVLKYFYRLAAGLKYYGFVLSVLSIILFLFVLSPPVSCIALAFFLIFGYSYWFPAIEATTRTRVEIWIFRIAMLLFNAVMLSNGI